ncbi:glycoside hydrolase family 13 protein [Hydnum rufescens UP504]|uniref:Glycoside hydrolase family 13 protein n=1 Tax=Hydnum rufescens UP504 TaxID=1448309 RepID=A0A9P6AMC6_9AGAM|nr:glycoside hydrolase family 13 protein [Hydnum rufescens UP504]
MQWWREVHVYQIYPMSFQDSNGDGIGDLKGIISRLDYLKSLGIDVLWLSPIYKSPNQDMGYDISSYRELDPRYGDMMDMDSLLEGLRSRGMKLMMDLVVNHTSDLHPWFVESRSSKSSPKRDWYIWRPAKFDAQGNRKPPNNWAAIWGGSAWEWDDNSQEYYLHLYLKEQPDLNWENVEVRRAVYDLMRWWLDKGVAGFRMDVINLISKPDGLPDLALTAWRNSMDARSEIMARYVLPSARELHMTFTFHHVDIDGGVESSLKPIKWSLSTFKEIINKWQSYMHNVGESRSRRSVSRFGNDSDEFRAISAKMLAIFHEIAMANVPEHWGIEEYKDVATQSHWTSVLSERKKHSSNPDMSDILSDIRVKARDNARTPVQWDDSPHAVNEDYVRWNASAQTSDPHSVLNFWKEALSLRKATPVLLYGSFRLVVPQDERIFAFERELDGERALVLLNFTQTTVEFTLPPDALANDFDSLRLRLANYALVESLLSRTVSLKPYEGRLYTSK